MRKFILSISMFLMVGLFHTSPAEAMKLTMNHQGLITNSVGDPVNGMVALTFNIYSDSVGGSPLWSEAQSVIAVSGLYSAVLGSSVEFPTALFNSSPLWLGIIVETDPELTPRTLLTSAPTSIHSWSTEGFNPGPNNVDLGQFSIVGGDNNTNNSDFSSILGGENNVVDVTEFADTVFDTSGLSPFGLTSYDAFALHPPGLGTILGGHSNLICGNHAVIVQGFLNINCAPYSILGDGFRNRIFGRYSSLGSGIFNDINLSAGYSVIGGGAFNKANSFNSVISGGAFNTTSAGFRGQVIGGGWRNTTDDNFSTISGGENNAALATHATVSGGQADTAFSAHSTVGGGLRNYALSPETFVGGGSGNRAEGQASTIGGGEGNLTSLHEFQFIGGGQGNVADGPLSTIGGGQSNETSTWATVGGGVQNRSINEFTFIGGGNDNLANAHAAVVGGGLRNTSSNWTSTTGGGQDNTSGGFASTVGGGSSNQALGDSSVVAGGASNAATGNSSAIGGGHKNNSSGQLSTIGGGTANTTVEEATTVSGGKDNGATRLYATVGGGIHNRADDTAATIGGGLMNSASGDAATVGGGFSNSAVARAATIAGGDSNIVTLDRGSIAGGSANSVLGFAGAIGGGAENIVGQGSYSTVPGGLQNEASGDFCFAAGVRAKAIDSCSFVWADCCIVPGQINSSPYFSSLPNSYNARATNGFYFLTTCDSVFDPANGVGGGVYVPPGGSMWMAGSDINLKRNLRPVDEASILDKVSQLPISRWSYKAQDESIEHIGPTAQDFYATFGVGDNNTSIGTLDPSGVALAAIKELKRENTELKDKVEELAKLVAGLIESQR